MLYLEVWRERRVERNGRREDGNGYWRGYFSDSPKKGVMTFNVRRKAFASPRTTDALLSMNNPSVIWLWLITYLLRESTETTPPAGRMSRTDVPQRELRGLTPRDTTQHYASEKVTAFQTEGHQLTTCLQIRRSLEGHVVRPEGIRNSFLSYSRPWTVIAILKNTEKRV